VLLLQFGFVLSYVGAFHTSTPHRIPIAVVAPAAISTKVVNGQNDITSTPLQATAVANQAVAREEVRNATTSAAFIVVPLSHVDRLILAKAGGTSVATAVVKIMTKVDASERWAVAVTDLVPVQPGDGEGLTGFYLVIGWIVGGYLVAALLGITAGSRPATPRRAAHRLVPYAIVSGFGGALIVDQVLGALTGHFLALWWLGALLVATAATVTMAFQAFLGVIGIGVTVLVFVILGNPLCRRCLSAPASPTLLANHRLCAPKRRWHGLGPPDRVLGCQWHRRPPHPHQWVCGRRCHHRPSRLGSAPPAPVTRRRFHGGTCRSDQPDGGSRLGNALNRLRLRSPRRTNRSAGRKSVRLSPRSATDWSRWPRLTQRRKGSSTSTWG